jgi:hypothetical protein
LAGGLLFYYQGHSGFGSSLASRLSISGREQSSFSRETRFVFFSLCDSVFYFVFSTLLSLFSCLNSCAPAPEGSVRLVDLTGRKGPVGKEHSLSHVICVHMYVYIYMYTLIDIR